MNVLRIALTRNLLNVSEDVLWERALVCFCVLFVRKCHSVLLLLLFQLRQIPVLPTEEGELEEEAEWIYKQAFATPPLSNQVYSGHSYCLVEFAADSCIVVTWFFVGNNSS